MKPSAILVFWIMPLIWCFTGTCLAAESKEEFTTWLKNLRQEARSSGISQATLDLALADIQKPVPKVIARDRKQPEFTQTTKKYVADRANNKRIVGGRKMMKRYPTWLARVEGQYGVQRRFIVALWGIESNYGKHTGSYPVIQSLVTLALDHRRAEYFRRELIEALHVLDEGQVPLRFFKGSWAGALGQCQFMPSSFRNYAVNADGGRLDIWTSVPDVLASTANYLARAGWKDDQTWGRPVKLPENFNYSLAGLDRRLPLSHWQSLGVRRSNGNALPGRNLPASLILPDGPGGPAFLVYDNFRTLLSWNRSTAFAIAVGTLSDRLDNS